MIPDPIIQAIEDATADSLDPGSGRTVGGGCINESHLIDSATGRKRYFVKMNRSERLSMFEAESEALAEIAATGTIRVPNPICHGVSGRYAFLALEGIDMGPNSTAEAQHRMGAQLAAMHRVTSPDGRFGWHRDNTIGETPQHNHRAESWTEFYAAHRLEFQFELASEKRGSMRFRGATELIDEVPGFFRDYSPTPSLLHGDLWGGNAAFTKSGDPVLFDPATYYGDRETDLAFTEMFGGFGAAFYEAYHGSYPIDPGYPRRKQLYNLYHLLNHYNLFGGGYASQAQSAIDSLLRES